MVSFFESKKQHICREWKLPVSELEKHESFHYAKDLLEQCGSWHSDQHTQQCRFSSSLEELTGGGGRVEVCVLASWGGGGGEGNQRKVEAANMRKGEDYLVHLRRNSWIDGLMFMFFSG